MSDISKIDKNFIINTNIEKDGIHFYNAQEEPFKIYGVFMENGQYRRMPESVANAAQEWVTKLHKRTAGGRLRFVTNSKYIVINAKMNNMVKASHFTLAGTSGFDMYVGDEYVKTFMPPQEATTGYEGIMEFSTEEYRDITINFPLYSEVLELYIGLDQNADIRMAKPYKNEKPIVFYGSSITMGGCASRAGRCYQAVVSREFNYDYVNLGFSGGAIAEDEMIDYIKNLDMHAFVLDYDHNAPNPEHLRATHEKMFLAVRMNHPDLPIIIMARPQYKLVGEDIERNNIVETTYTNAVSRGDKNVYFLSHAELTKLCKGEGTIDGTHPTDFGFASMANALCEVIRNNNI